MHGKIFAHLCVKLEPCYHMHWPSYLNKFTKQTDDHHAHIRFVFCLNPLDDKLKVEQEQQEQLKHTLISRHKNGNFPAKLIMAPVKIC